MLHFVIILVGFKLNIVGEEKYQYLSCRCGWLLVGVFLRPTRFLVWYGRFLCYYYESKAEGVTQL